MKSVKHHQRSRVETVKRRGCLTDPVSAYSVWAYWCPLTKQWRAKQCTCEGAAARELDSLCSSSKSWAEMGFTARAALLSRNGYSRCHCHGLARMALCEMCPRDRDMVISILSNAKSLTRQVSSGLRSLFKTGALRCAVTATRRATALASRR